MKHLQQLARPSTPAYVVPPRRGATRQRPQRDLEQRVRGHVVDFCQWTKNLGWRPTVIAGLLQLAPRTLRQWCHDQARGAMHAAALGRPVLRSAPTERNEVIALLNELGPALGLPTLQACFPHMARAELADLLGRYRRAWRRRYQQALHVLDWRTAGTVWAMDFAEAPQPIDGLYPYLLAVRDLASGQQLLWLPVRHPTAEETIAALEPLLVGHGAPLVLKTDNGPAFCAAATLAFLASWHVLPLFSPPYTPQYNGAIEAGIGSLKTRTERHASRSGRPTEWNCDDVAAAQAEANATARPKGPSGPTPEELWAARRPVSAEQRACFGATVERQRPVVRQEAGWGTDGPVADKDARAIDRQAIRRALEEHGFLLYSRRRFPLPFPKRKAAKIS
jgi:transposase InsO family protein